MGCVPLDSNPSGHKTTRDLAFEVSQPCGRLAMRAAAELSHPRRGRGGCEPEADALAAARCRCRAYLAERGAGSCRKGNPVERQKLSIYMRYFCKNRPLDELEAGHVA